MQMLLQSVMVRTFCRSALMALALLLPASLSAQTNDSHDEHQGHDMSRHMNPNSTASSHDSHAGHHNMTHNGKKVEMFDGELKANTNYKRTTSAYNVPNVTLRDQNGAVVELVDYLAEPGPVAMQFIFTSCATVCPVLSAGFAQSVTEMTTLDGDVRLLSISIDPEHDTPDRLNQYAKRYGAPDNWTFLTGTRNDIRTVIMAFDALFESDNKVYHRPYTYMRGEPGDDWVRIDGLMSKASLLEEYTYLVRRKSASSAH